LEACSFLSPQELRRKRLGREGMPMGCCQSLIPKKRLRWDPRASIRDSAKSRSCFYTDIGKETMSRGELKWICQNLFWKYFLFPYGESISINIYFKLDFGCKEIDIGAREDMQRMALRNLKTTIFLVFKIV